MGIIVLETSFHYMEKSMNKRDYKPRLIDRKLEEYLNTFGAVCVEGPKWCGKTWSSSYHSNSEIMIGNPDGNFQNRKCAVSQCVWNWDRRIWRKISACW